MFFSSLSNINQPVEKIREDYSFVINRAKILLIGMICLLVLPLLIRFFMALIIISNTTCRQEWIQHNPLMLWVSIGRVVVEILSTILERFFKINHNLSKGDKVPLTVDAGECKNEDENVGEHKHKPVDDINNEDAGVYDTESVKNR